MFRIFKNMIFSENNDHVQRTMISYPMIRSASPQLTQSFRFGWPLAWGALVTMVDFDFNEKCLAVEFWGSWTTFGDINSWIMLNPVDMIQRSPWLRVLYEGCFTHFQLVSSCPSTEFHVSLLPNHPATSLLADPSRQRYLPMTTRAGILIAFHLVGYYTIWKRFICWLF